MSGAAAESTRTLRSGGGRGRRWGAPSELEREQALLAALEAHNREVEADTQLTLAEVAKHLKYHRPRQPTQSVQVRHRAAEEAAFLRPRDRKVLELVARLDKIGPQAFSDHFRCLPGSARRTLRRLAYRGLLYRQQYKQRHLGAVGNRTVYYLTPLGKAIVEHLREGADALAVKGVHRAEAVGQLALAHVSANVRQR